MTADTDPPLLPNHAYVSVRRYFEISLFLMLSASFATLASTGRLDPFSILAFSAALGIELAGYVRGAGGYRLPPRLVARLALAYLFFYVFDFTFLAPGPGPMDRLLAASVHLVLFVIIIKMFSARRYRDYGYLAALSFLMMLAGAVLTTGTAYLIGLAIYVLFAISMLISYEVKRGIDKADRIPGGPYRNALRNRVAIENSLVLATMGLALGVAALGSILFFVIPRYHAAYFNHLAPQAQDLTGFTSDVELADIGMLRRSNAVVMRVKIEGSPQEFRGVKWRGIALTSFTGRRWFDHDLLQTRLAPVAPERFVIPDKRNSHDTSGRILRYQVLLSGLSTDVLFTAAQPHEILGRFPAIGLDETGSLHDLGHGGGAVIYHVVSGAAWPSPSLLRAASSDYSPSIRARYLSLPALDPRVRKLAGKITAHATNNYDRAADIASYLRQNYDYTLNPPPIEPAHPIAGFLFESRKGYCAYFASSMAVMLRTLGIPARIVNGFETGAYNRVGGDFIVRARDAHSWVEVYFPGDGWIPFDPTPSGRDSLSDATPGTLDAYLDAASLFWNEWVINYDFGRQAMLARQVNYDSHSLRRDARRWLTAIETSAAAGVHDAVNHLAAHKLAYSAFSLLLFFGAITLWKRSWPRDLRFPAFLRFGSQSQPFTAREATLAYRRFLKHLRAKGWEKSPSQTPGEFARSIPNVAVKPVAIEFTRLYNAIRFGREPISPHSLRTLLEELSARMLKSGKA